MQKNNKVAFTGFSLENNVFVKDLNYHSQAKYYKYIIDGVEYFVPNYGHLVMLDSHYTDVVTSDGKLGYHVIGPYFGDSSNISETNFKNFEKAIDPDNFGTAFKENGGAIPKRTVEFLGEIKKEIAKEKNKDIKYYIEQCFVPLYANNRIGTILTEQEVLNVIQNGNINYKKGDIVAYEFQHNTYKFALYMGPAKKTKSTTTPKEKPKEDSDEDSDDEDNGRLCKIYIKNEHNSDIISTIVPSADLYQYQHSARIDQTINQSDGASPNNVLETYVI
jgi:hypothetical protein